MRQRWFEDNSKRVRNAGRPVVITLRFFLILTLLAGWGPVTAAQETPDGTAYRLGTGDEIRVIVQDQPQASGQATIVDDGYVALPLLDGVNLAGNTVREASAAIRQKLAAKFVDPVVAVEVSHYRPFFVLGDVATPGMYPWFPGATVAQAVAVAGGYRGKNDYLQTVVAGIRAVEALAVARYELAVARVQEARLHAEIDGTAMLAAPQADDAASAPLLSELTAREQVVLTTRVTGFAKQIELLKREQAIRTDEMAALDERIKSQGRQDEKLLSEITDVQVLVSHGNSPITRLNDLYREQNRLQSDTLQTQVLLNQARNGRNQAELQGANITRERRVQLLVDQQDAEGRIQRLREQVRAETSIVLEAAALQGQPGGEGVTTRFWLQGKGATTNRAADDNTGVAPGDVLRVERNLASASGGNVVALGQR
ncbi:polysaccharide biosynthesis/export family protein [Lichenifustis flavocetrariae]|uniref:Polysaccharide biosynthesis/export family protein n=1 Tax=Lichenifustis flavocetrariae TaxID=2949735 RepID=A0AA42CQD3_9HYPH|nr:polysaccharide biosynthesis/export family protein [Lichenifustis flavocetrariae]MCW6511342.1 polysaccharide biosynthesis/export family protein [Lichenifustis flavocetrariae]